MSVERALAEMRARIRRCRQDAEETSYLERQMNQEEADFLERMVALLDDKKQASRDEDARRLAAGEVSREQLWAENTFLPAASTRVDFSRVPVLK